MTCSGECDSGVQTVWWHEANDSVGECPGDEAVDKYSMYSRKSDPQSQMLQMVFHFHQ
jgi:hypothetical protein